MSLLCTFYSHPFYYKYERFIQTIQQISIREGSREGLQVYNALFYCSAPSSVNMYIGIRKNKRKTQQAYNILPGCLSSSLVIFSKTLSCLISSFVIKQLNVRECSREVLLLFEEYSAYIAYFIAKSASVLATRAETDFAKE